MEKLSNRNSIKILILLIFGGILMRLYFTPFHIPISLDGIDYFGYAVAMSREGTFPTGYLLTNFGWSSFVSIFFSFDQNTEMLTLMNIQRILSIIISVSTAIPIYYLMRNFFRKDISLLATTLFLFDPRIIENSILGITDSLFVFLVVLTVFFVFYKKSSWIYISFSCAAIAAFVRYEGILLIVPIIISYVLKKKQHNLSKLKFVIGICLFLIIIIPINFIDYEEAERTSVFYQIVAGGKYISENIINDKPDIDDKFYGPNVENRVQIFIENTISGLVKYVGWGLVPIFITFCILGIIFMPKKITENKIIFGVFFVVLGIAGAYAYGRGIQDTRYILVLLPIFGLLSGYGFSFLLKYGVKKIIISIIISVIITSFIFVEFRNQNDIYDFEIYEATLFLVKESTGINDYQGNKFVKVAELQNNWPELLPKDDKRKMTFSTKKFLIEGFENPIEYIKFNQNKGLSHLLITENNKNGFFDDVFINEGNYPFLEKIYDSENKQKITKYKIFKINYGKLK